MKEIKLTDFRIGNCITDDFGVYVHEVLSIDRLFIIAKHPKAGLYSTKKPIPILLTPEKLLALGFEDWGRIECEFVFKRWVLFNVIDGTSNFEVRQYDYGGWEYSIDSDETINLPNSEYLHTLQNAFFLFAGYDLGFDFTKIKGQK